MLIPNTWTVTPASQSVAVGSAATLTNEYSGTVPVDGVNFTFSDGGGGGSFSPSSLVDAPPTATFTYTNNTPGTYNITVHGATLPFSGMSDRTATVIVTESNSHDCFEYASPKHPAVFDISALQLLRFNLTAPSDGEWYGGTVNLVFTLDKALTGLTADNPAYLLARVRSSDNPGNLAAMAVTMDIYFPLVNGQTDYDITLPIPDSWLDDIQFGATSDDTKAKNFTVALFGNGNIFRPKQSFPKASITHFTICMRNSRKTAISGSGNKPIGSGRNNSPCGTNSPTTQSLSLSGTSLYGLKYVFTDTGIDANLSAIEVVSGEGRGKYESQHAVIRLTFTVPTPATYPAFGWLDGKLTIYGSYAPVHAHGTLETSDDYPTFRLLAAGTDNIPSGAGVVRTQAPQPSDVFDGRFPFTFDPMADASTNGIVIYADVLTNPADSPSINQFIGQTYVFYLYAEMIGQAQDASGNDRDSVADWGRFTISRATFTSRSCYQEGPFEDDASKRVAFGSPPSRRWDFWYADRTPAYPYVPIGSVQPQRVCRVTQEWVWTYYDEGSSVGPPPDHPELGGTEAGRGTSVSFTSFGPYGAETHPGYHGYQWSEGYAGPDPGILYPGYAYVSSRTFTDVSEFYCECMQSHTNNGVCMIRDYTHRMMVFSVNTARNMMAYLFDDTDQSPQVVTIDSETTCFAPSFWRDGVYIGGTYLRETTPVAARSMSHGRTWKLTTIPGTYDNVTSANSKGRAVILGYKNGSSAWFCRVGVPADDGTYTWSNEVMLTLSSPNGSGSLREREDGVLEFTWLDTSNAAHIVRGRGISNSGGSASNWT